MSTIKSIDPTELSQPDLHHLLLSAVAPRPICFASSIDASGNVNLSPFSFFNVFSSAPPILIFSPAKGRNGHKHTLQNIREVKEVVINIVNYPIVEQMSLSSTAYPKGVNEFEKSGLTEVPSDKILPPRVGEAPVSMECIVENIIELGENIGAGNLVIVKVVKIHVQEKYLDADSKLDTEALDLVARLGGNWYSRVVPDSLFEIPKPLRAIGIGIDQLPKKIRESKHLTGNQLARLGSIDMLPSSDEIKKVSEKPIVNELFSNYNTEPARLERELYSVVEALIERNETRDALSLLLYHLKQYQD